MAAAGMQVVFWFYNRQKVVQKIRVFEISGNTIELFIFDKPWDMSHCALTVRLQCVHLRFSLRSVHTHRSQSAQRALNLRSQIVHRSLIVQSVFFHFHSELQNERIGKHDSLWYPYFLPILLKIFEKSIDFSPAPSCFFFTCINLYSVVER